jgi:DUF1680 family protein
MDDVRWTTGFWADRFKLVHKAAVPNMWDILSDPDIAHAWQNFQIAAGLQDGGFCGRWWHDGDLYKWLEAASYVYAITSDAELDGLMDKVIDVICRAQREDGYIHTSILIGHGFRTHPQKGFHFEGKTEPYQDLADHELYNMGHLMTAGCIHFRATGKRTLLDIAVKTGDHLYETFHGKDPGLAHFGFNPSQIMGAVELYRTTGDRKYLELAKLFIEMRGSAPDGTDQNQDRTPLRDETEAVGHAVTANYLYAGAADLVAETGDKEIMQALERLWQDVASTKMSVTGATGAYHRGVSSARDVVGEAYGRQYELPNTTAYNETCANIANAMWNWRMLSVTGDAYYADIVELVLYNSALSAISLDGTRFFYTNPLRRLKASPLLSHDLKTRHTYIACFCCPPNIVRTMAKVHGWAYSVSENTVWVNLYGASELNAELPSGDRITLVQETDYPWDGRVKITLDSLDTKSLTMMLRIPGWSKNAGLQVNGKPVMAATKSGTYAALKRTWSAGDVIELELPMPVRLLEANPLVEENRNHVAVKRGPIVYCLESPDLPEGVAIFDVMIPANIKLKPVYEEDLLGGVVALTGDFIILETDEKTQCG